jgi:hypothetical protein
VHAEIRHKPSHAPMPEDACNASVQHALEAHPA